MTADNRTVTTDALETLGSIIGEGEKRDAIHLAVEPVTATEKCFAGQHVGLLSNGSASLFAETKLGIVDPFLTTPVEPGERFWLVVYPRQISSLRHVWEHPAFPASGETDVGPGEPRSASEKWMRLWAMKHVSEDYYGEGGALPEEQAYAFAIQAGETLSLGPYEDARDFIDAEWWSHWETITGKKGNRSEYFSCAC